MVASRLAHAWARIYTRGMPEPERRARLDELASDLWEHVDHAVSSGRRRGAAELEIAGRTARGVAADVAWRFAHRSGPLSPGILRLAGWTAFGLGTAFILTLTATSGAPVLGIYKVESWEPGEARENARVMAAAFTALVAGLALLRRHASVGTALVSLACAGISVYALWLWPILVPCSAACIAGAVAVSRHGRAVPLGPTVRETLIAAAAGGLAVYAFLVAPLLTPVVLAGAVVTAFVRRRHTARAA
jgi:hypothetical protein